MKRFVVGVMSAAVLVSMPRAAAAQVKTVSSEMRTETAIVEAIDVPTRAITLEETRRYLRHDRRRTGHHALFGGQGWRQGQRPLLRQRRRPAEAARRTGRLRHHVSYDALRTDHARWHQGDAADDHRHDRRIDMNAPSVPFTGPNGWKYTSKVQDTAALAKVKIGDRLEIVWTEAVLVSLSPGK